MNSLGLFHALASRVLLVPSGVTCVILARARKKEIGETHGCSQCPVALRLVPASEVVAGFIGIFYGRIAAAFQQPIRRIGSFLKDLDLFISFSVARLMVWRAKHK
jgi:hypothetical protein